MKCSSIECSDDKCLLLILVLDTDFMGRRHALIWCKILSFFVVLDDPMS
jgi:hypothetical protein